MLPSGWKQVIQESSYSILPGDVSIRLIVISIPSNAPANEYVIRYKVHDRAKIAHEGSVSFVVIVPRFDRFELKIFKAPQYVIAGKTFVTDVLLTNQGNSTSVFRLRYRSSQDFPVRIDSAIVHLTPKENRHIQISVATNTLSKILNHTLELEATLQSDPSVSERISSVVKIIQRETTVEEKYLEFPISVRLREVGQNGKYATQGEFSGYGSLNEQRTDHFEFLLRTPETQSVSIFGQRDEYSMSYRTNRMKLYAGDQNYSLSPLTEVGRSAVGIGGSISIGEFFAGGFYNETRWMTPRQKEIGGFLNYQFKKDASFGINYLSKRESSSSDIVTLRSLFAPFSGSNLDLELGTGKKNNKSGNAVAARFDGIQKWLTYDLRYIQAGANFGGYYQDMNFITASINAQVTRDIRILSYASVENGDSKRDTNQMHAPHENHYQIGAGYADFISLFYRYIGREGWFDSVRYRNREDAIQSRLGYKLLTMSIYATADIGTRSDKLNAREMPFKRFSLYSNFNPGPNQNYGSSLEYEAIRDSVSGKDQERLSANLNTMIHFGQSTKMQLYLYGSRLIVSPLQTNSMFEVSIEHEFSFHHAITLRGRLSIITPSTNAHDVACALEYVIPISFPIKRITAVGQLRGSITDEEGRGIKNVLLIIGDEAALSDKQGSFFFTTLKPGIVHLSVDNATIGFQNIPSQSMPMELFIRGGEESKIALSVSRSSTISGSISMFVEKRKNILDTLSLLIETGGKSGVFLELSNKAEVQRRVSDSRGNFLFEDLRSGSWTLKVTGGDIPEYQIIDPDSINIMLIPGEKRNIPIQIRPLKRSIKILQEGTVIK